MTVDLRFIHLEVAEETRLMLEDRIETQFQEF